MSYKTVYKIEVATNSSKEQEIAQYEYLKKIDAELFVEELKRNLKLNFYKEIYQEVYDCTHYTLIYSRGILSFKKTVKITFWEERKEDHSKFQESMMDFAKAISDLGKEFKL